jgi:hypothetical protein
MASKKSTKAWYEEPKFLELQREWDTRLKEDGFQDIEFRHSKNGDSDYLNGVNTMYFVRKGRYRCVGDADYYATARSYRWELRKAPRADIDTIRVWDLHTAGWSISRICDVLQLGRRVVTKLITKHRELIRKRAREGDPI